MGEEIKQWIKSIILFVLFLSLVQQLIAGKKYEKYMRLFAGMILILLVAAPVIRVLDGENFFEYYYMENAFSQAANEAAMEVERLGEAQKERVSESYQRQLRQSLQEIVNRFGFTLVAADVELYEEGEQYLYPNQIELSVKKEQGQTPTKDVKVEDITLPQIAGKIQSINEETKDDEMAKEDGITEEISNLRKRIAEFFCMEEGAVSIEVV